MNPVVFASTFLLGIFGSLHCLGMCGPLALAVPFPAGSGSRSRAVLVYYAAKAAAYGSMGLVMGLLGKVVMLMEWQQTLSIVSGAFILVLAFFPFLKQTRGRFLFQKQFIRIYQALQQSPRWYYFFSLGFLNGLLPCGLVYTALAAAMLAGSPAGGGIAMLLFGFGTAPVLVLLVLFRHKISPQVRNKLKPASVILSALIGMLLILRGLNLGVPYLSPHADKTQVSQCCHSQR